MLKLLDTTLRDGSYVIDFQFTSNDTAVIAARLDEAGAHYIEVGHGLGLRAGSRPDMRQPEPDEAYLEAAAAAVKRNKWGMFFIPGIGTLEDVELAARYGMHFIRVGTNVTEIEQSEKYIRRAKELGMEVFANYMKTYASTPDEVAARAVISASYGADHVCVVDSAGGMLPEDVTAYITAIKKRTDVSVGFHGHNNLGLAVANSLVAIDAGAAIVDTSVRGMGRSSGNTVTEIFLLTLKRKGIDLGIDVTAILDLAEKHIDPLLKNYQQVDSIGIISGYAQFHSSYLGKILDYANRYRIDPRELIVRVTNVDRVNAPDDLVNRLSQELADEQQGGVERILVEFPASKKELIPDNLVEQVNAVVAETSSLSRKWAKTAVFNLVQTVRENSRSFISPAIHDGSHYIVASGETASAADAAKIAAAVDGKASYLLLDTDLKNENSSAWINAVRDAMNKTIVLSYSDTEVWARTVTALARELVQHNQPVTVYGTNPLAAAVRERLLHHFSTVSAAAAGALTSGSPLLVMCMPYSGETINADNYSNSIIIDAWLGSFQPAQVDALQNAGAKMYRIDMSGMIHSEILASAAMQQVVDNKMGMAELDGVPVASGGIIAAKGTVIVDSFTSPHKVFGVADGRGFLIPAAQLDAMFAARLEKIQNYMLARAVNS